VSPSAANKQPRAKSSGKGSHAGGGSRSAEDAPPTTSRHHSGAAGGAAGASHLSPPPSTAGRDRAWGASPPAGGAGAGPSAAPSPRRAPQPHGVDVSAFVERLRVSKAQVRHTGWVPAREASYDAPAGFRLPCELAAVLARAGAMPLYRRVRRCHGCAHARLCARVCTLLRQLAACASAQTTDADASPLRTLVCRAFGPLPDATLRSHQSHAISEALAGKSVVVSTPTASGKSVWCAHAPPSTHTR
jgi:hypothetical protein